MMQKALRTAALAAFGVWAGIAAQAQTAPDATNAATEEILSDDSAAPTPEGPAEAKAAPQRNRVTTSTGISRDCQPGIGCVTKRPLPRYVSLKGAEARARRGPGQDHKVDWIYQRAGMPVKVTAEYENWRRIEDPEGAGGWIHYALLSNSRTGIVVPEMADLLSRPEPGSSVVARAQQGAILRISECRAEMCRVSKDGLRGWLPKSALWGVEGHEIFD